MSPETCFLTRSKHHFEIHKKDKIQSSNTQGRQRGRKWCDDYSRQQLDTVVKPQQTWRMKRASESDWVTTERGWRWNCGRQWNRGTEVISFRKILYKCQDQLGIPGMQRRRKYSDHWLHRPVAAGRGGASNTLCCVEQVSQDKSEVLTWLMR